MSTPMYTPLANSNRVPISRVCTAVYVVASMCLIVSCSGRGSNGSGSSGGEQSSATVEQTEISTTATYSQTTRSEPAEAENLGSLRSLESKTFDAAIRDIVVREDPTIDGWEMERLSDLVTKRLNVIGNLLSGTESVGDLAVVTSLCDASFRSTNLRPKKQRTAFQSPEFIVRRPESSELSIEHTGAEGFRSAIAQLAEPIAGKSGVHFKFKVIRVERENRAVRTQSYFEISGRGAEESVQINATWTCTWTLNSENTAMLSSIHVSDYEEVFCTTVDQQSLFVDCTESAFRGLPILQEQLVHGRDHWYGNLEATIGVEGRGNGIAIADVNGDGLDDIYFCQPAGLPNRLFIRRNDGSMQDVSADAGVDWLDSSRAAIFVDLDNDGDQDLVLTHSTTVVVQENDGTGRFTLRTTLATNSRLFSINAVDNDNDSDLDLFICGYSSAANTRPEDVFVSPVPYHDANNGGPNHLFRNNGDWSFSDVTKQVGLDVNNLRFSLASTWDDFDNDGDLDLYVANDFGRNNLYRNDSGKFTDITGVANVEDVGPGMSATWNDYNNDGFVDLYVSNMFSSAGSRITHNAQFKPGANSEDIAGFRRHARGNSLFQNDQNGRFVDQSVPAAVTIGRWAWGSLFVDLNNDGWRDIYVVNGFVTADNTNDL